MNGNVLSEQKINLNCEDLKKAKKLFEYLDFKERVRVKYHVIVYSNGYTEFAFQEVENLGTLIEYENINDFEGKTIEDINKVKEEMYNEIVKTGIKVTEEKDIKKAYELIVKKLEKGAVKKVPEKNEE